MAVAPPPPAVSQSPSGKSGALGMTRKRALIGTPQGGRCLAIGIGAKRHGHGCVARQETVERTHKSWLDSSHDGDDDGDGDVCAFGVDVDGVCSQDALS